MGRRITQLAAPGLRDKNSKVRQAFQIVGCAQLATKPCGDHAT